MRFTYVHIQDFWPWDFKNLLDVFFWAESGTNMQLYQQVGHRMKSSMMSEIIQLLRENAEPYTVCLLVTWIFFMKTSNLARDSSKICCVFLVDGGKCKFEPCTCSSDTRGWGERRGNKPDSRLHKRESRCKTSCKLWKTPKASWYSDEKPPRLKKASEAKFGGNER